MSTTAATSQRVDVLAVMAKACRKCAGPDFAQLEEARAAVAELIEAAQHVLDKDWEYGEDQPHCARLNAALRDARGEP